MIDFSLQINSYCERTTMCVPIGKQMGSCMQQIELASTARAPTSGEVLARGLKQLTNNCLRERPASECAPPSARVCARWEGGGPLDSRTRPGGDGAKTGDRQTTVVSPPRD